MKLQVGITESRPLWTTLLDQEKTSYQVVSAPVSPADFPVLLVPRSILPYPINSLYDYLEKGGIVIASKETIKQIPANLHSRTLSLELPSDHNGNFYQGDGLKRFISGDISVTETVARQALHPMRKALARILQDAFWKQGLPYARLSYYPFPFENMFSFRFDLDHYDEADFQVMCRLINQYPHCTSCFVSAKTHENASEALKALAKLPTEIGSHSYVHHVYQSYEQNAFNLERAEQVLESAVGKIEGFSAPHGRWTPSLQRVLEERGYLYSSEFGLDYDGFPFFAYTDNRRSSVLQIPAHPICEGVFMEQYPDSPVTKMHDYYRDVINAKIQAGEPILIFGHPDQRIGRHPEIFEQIMRELDSYKKRIWKTEFRKIALWWKKRHDWNYKAEWVNGSLKVADFLKDDEASLELIFEKTRLRLQGNDLQKELSKDEISRRAGAYIKNLPKIVEENVLLTPVQTGKRALKLWLDWETKTPLHLYKIKNLSDFLRSLLRTLYDKFMAPRKKSDIWAAYKG